MTHAKRLTAHASALVTDRRYYVTCASNALFQLRYVRAHKRYYLHRSDNVSVMLDAASASAVYDAIKRHVVRIALDVSCTRTSVYTMRSDIRAIVRAKLCAKFAH